MECTLATLIACFSWSGLYLDFATEIVEQPNRQFTDTYYGETLYVMPENGSDPFLQRNVVREFDSSSRRVRNPYIRPSIGYEIDARSVRIDVSGFYQESARISDKGEFGAALRFRWFPLK